MRSRTTCVFVLLTHFVAFSASVAQTPPPAKQQEKPKPQTETFWHRVLRVSGIAESPSTLKGPGDESSTVKSGSRKSRRAERAN